MTIFFFSCFPAAIATVQHNKREKEREIKRKWGFVSYLFSIPLNVRNQLYGQKSIQKDEDR